MIRHTRTPVFILTLILNSIIPSWSSPTQSKYREPLNIAFWIGGHSHDFESSTNIIKEALPNYLNARISTHKNASFLNPNIAERPDVIVMYHCFTFSKGKLSAIQKDCLLKWVKEGTGVVALHSSYYSFTKWNEIRQLYGAKFIKHGKVTATLDILLEDFPHPIIKGIPKMIDMKSELYQSTKLPKDCKVLATYSERGKNTSHPAIWTRNYGVGKVVTILPGHYPENYQIDAFQQLIANSILWVAKKNHSSPRVEDKAYPFTHLFNGKNLEGWKGDPELWKIEEGAIVGSTYQKKLKSSSFLIWQAGEVGDFELEYQCKVEGNNNSGVVYRGQLHPSIPWEMKGNQADIHPKPEFCAMLWSQGTGRKIVARRGTKVVVDATTGKPQVVEKWEPVMPVDIAKWNTYRVVARGNHIQHFVNGELAIDLIDQHPNTQLTGLIGLQLHGGKPMKVYFKSIRLNKNLSP